MANLTDDEWKFVRLMVEREVKEIEKHEKDFASLISNSPFLSNFTSHNKDIEFLASQEKYHQFLKTLQEKIK